MLILGRASFVEPDHVLVVRFRVGVVLSVDVGGGHRPGIGAGILPLVDFRMAIGKTEPTRVGVELSLIHI